jgi:hypothetical protein
VISGLRSWIQHGFGMRIRRRFWVRLTLAVISAALFVITLAWPNWIEIAFRVDPDHGGGWLEWTIVVVMFALTLTLSIGARREWRRSVTAAIVSDGAS